MIGLYGIRLIAFFHSIIEMLHFISESATLDICKQEGHPKCANIVEQDAASGRKPPAYPIDLMPTITDKGGRKNSPV